MLLTLSLAAAFAKAPPPTDLDGDKKPDTIVVTEDSVQVGAASVECYSDAFQCEVAILDVRRGDGSVELQVCSLGPRDDRYCRLYRYASGALTELALTDAKGETLYPSALSSAGTGILLADDQGRTHSRRHKLVLSKDGRSFTYVPQPFWTVDYKVHVDRTLPITMSAGGGAVVANVRSDSDIAVLLESTEDPEHVLVRISSGLVGWTSWEALTRASDQLMTLQGAG